MTRTYGEIKEVYIQGQGWVNYSGQPLTTIEMLNVEYTRYDNNDNIIQQGTEDFSVLRWVKSQGIDIRPNGNPFTVLTAEHAELCYNEFKGYNNTPNITEGLTFEPIIVNKQVEIIITPKKQRVNPYDKIKIPTTKKQKEIWEYFTNKGLKFKYIQMKMWGNYKRKLVWTALDENINPVGRWEK